MAQASSLSSIVTAPTVVGDTSTIPPQPPSAHSPSVAGSVLEARDGMGGTCLVRIQNMSATGRCFEHKNALVVSLLRLFTSFPHDVLLVILE